MALSLEDKLGKLFQGAVNEIYLTGITPDSLSNCFDEFVIEEVNGWMCDYWVTAKKA